MKRFLRVATICITAVLAVISTEAFAQQGAQRVLKEWRDGDYIVRRCVVTDSSPQSENYEIHYAINSANTIMGFEDNSEELARLDSFFNNLKRDSTIHLLKIEIVGYASPDGTTKFNSELARKRAQELSSVVTNRYGLSTSNIAISSHVEPWSATSDAINSSNLSNRGDLVRIVNSNEPPMTIDNELKHEDVAWSWIKSDVLPDMRRATVAVLYTKDRVTDNREYKPVNSAPKEVIVVEEIVEEKPSKRHHDYDKHRKHGGHRRNVVVFNEWDGVIIDMGAASEGGCLAGCK